MIDVIENLANGIIPQSLEDLSATGRVIVQVNARAAQTLSVIISAGRKQINNDKTWVRWCEDEFNIDNVCYRSHLVKIGDMLNGLLNISVVYYKRLFDLASDVQLSISRIDIENIGAFLADNPNLNYRDRDKVRLAVAQFLGEQPKEKVQQLNLPGFDDALDALVNIQPNKLQVAITSNDKATKSLTASMGLLGASMEYYKVSKDFSIEMLAQIKTVLLDEIKELDKLMASDMSEISE